MLTSFEAPRTPLQAPAAALAGQRAVEHAAKEPSRRKKNTYNYIPFHSIPIHSIPLHYIHTNIHTYSIDIETCRRKLWAFRTDGVGASMRPLSERITGDSI